MKPTKPMKPAMLAWAGTLTVLSAMTGCSLAPSYQQPEVAQAAAFKEPLPAGWKVAEPSDAEPKGDWWTPFGDAGLNALEARVIVNNQNLRAALARYDQARAAAGLARAANVPLINLNAAATRSRTSENSAKHLQGSPLSNDLSLGVNLTYEIDVWGRVRNAVQAGDARVQASAADLEALQLSVRTDLAIDYFTLRGYERGQAVLGQTLQAYEQQLDLARRRFDGGLVTEVDVDQARLLVENTRATLADLKMKSRQMSNAIALLVGESASSFALSSGDLPNALPQVATGQPSTLLERRPDVAAAERRVRAANADIGVARAGYFPTFSIAAAAGFDSAHNASWFEAPSRFWSIGPQALLNLVDGGRVESNVAGARAVLDEASANYRQTALTAFKDVEDGLVSINQLAEEGRSLTIAEDAAQRAFDQSSRQYAGGLVTYLAVSVAQVALSQAQQASVNNQVAQLNARVQLIKALGGGWHANEPGNDQPRVVSVAAAASRP